MKRITILVLVIFLAIGLNACRKPDPKYGREFNEERKKVGVPVIPDNWKLESVLPGQSVWVNPEGTEKENNRVPYHWSKTVNYRTGTLISEADTYYGREDYTTVDGTSREHLTIMYFYLPDSYHYMEEPGWQVRFSANQVGFIKEISLEEAEKILEEWGIKRLSYEFSPQD